MSGDDEYGGRTSALQRGLRKLDNQNGEWLVHLGDILDEKSSCQENEYENFQSIYSQSAVPVYTLPGDNEWKRCPNPDQAWGYWEKYLSNLNTKFWGAPKQYTVQRQSSRNENFAFMNQGIQYVGVNMVAGPIDNRMEWADRHADNLAWIEQNVNDNFNNIHAIIIFGHAGPCCDRVDAPLNILDDEFFEPLSLKADEWKKTTIFIQETNNKYTWSWQSNLEGVSHFWLIKVQSGIWPPMRIEIERTANTIQFDQNGIVRKAFMNKWID